MKLIYTDDDIKQYLELTQGESTLGRSSKATFTIRNDTISKVHVKFKLDGGVFEIEDLGSSNGTFVNGVKITTVKLKPSDSIQIGKLDFKLEFTTEEMKSFEDIETATPGPGEITPLGSDVVEEEKGAESETFFDVSSLNAPSSSSATPKSLPAVQLSSNISANATNSKESTTNAGGLKSILANRKLMLMSMGGFLIVLMMVSVLVELGKPKQNEINMGKTSVANTNLDKYERLLKEGISVFKSDPEAAKKMFTEAKDNVSNKNSCLALMKLCDIWIESNKGWYNIRRSDLRKLLDDLRNEDEGQPGAMLFEFIKSMSDEERESLKVENEFAKFVSFLEQGMVSDAEKKILDIDRSSPLRAMAESKFKASKNKLINNLKDDVDIARTTSNTQMEVRKIASLIKLLDPSETIDYRKRLEKLKQDLKKDNVWRDANAKFEEKNYVEAKELLILFEPTDDNYSAAQTMLKEITMDELKKQIQFFYDIQGDGKTAIAYIDKSYSATFLELKEKISAVDRSFDEALRLGEQNEDNPKAHDLMQKVIELEPNSENAYHKKAEEYLKTWTDPIRKCQRLYSEAKKKLTVRDYDNARDLIEQINNTNKDYDVSELMKKIEKYIGTEMNLNYRNGKSAQIRKRTIEDLSKIVRNGDKYYDEIQEALLKVQQ